MDRDKVRLYSRAQFDSWEQAFKAGSPPRRTPNHERITRHVVTVGLLMALGFMVASLIVLGYRAIEGSL